LANSTRFRSCTIATPTRPRTVPHAGHGADFRGFFAVIPADYVTAEWDLQIYVTIQGPSGSCVMIPGVYHPTYPYPYHVISVAQHQEERK
jgi:hypothetical protein